jgi:two-component system sensor histidine kinase/response regulator
MLCVCICVCVCVCAAPATVPTADTMLSDDMVSDLSFLVVDDSKPLRKVLCKMLRSRTQYVRFVAEAEDGAQGVEQVRQCLEDGDPFDCVLLDYIMPGMNGPQTVEKMRSLGFKGIVLGVTGDVRKTTSDGFIAHGADRVLAKPVGFQLLYDTLRGIWCFLFVCLFFVLFYH